MKSAHSASRVALAAALYSLFAATAAHAVDDGRIQVTVPSTGQTSLKLFNFAGAPVPASNDPTTFTNLKAGTYTLEAARSGKVSTTTIAVKEDETCQAKVEDDGNASFLRCFAPLQARKQQQQGDMPLSFGFLGGYKDTPYRANVSTSFGPGGRVGLGDDGGVFGIEGRYHLSMPRPGDSTFIYGGYEHYSGLDTRRIRLNFHFGLPNDSGARLEERDSFRFGIGRSWSLSDKFSVEAMVGAHATRVRGSVISNEAEGGGPLNVFSRGKTLWGPSLSLGGSFPLYKVPGSNRSVRGLIRYTANWMDDVKVGGISPSTGFRYDASIKGGRQDQFQLGVMYPF